MTSTAIPARDTRHHVVIIGAGFGGLFAAKALRRVPVRVTLIDRTNHHLFQPLLYQVATGILSEGQIAPASRDIFRHYRSMKIVLGEVKAIQPEGKTLEVLEFGSLRTIAYDSLIVAAGATTSYFGHDEYRPLAPGMKSLDDALLLREQIFSAFERAEAEEDDQLCRALMTFVVVGGGPTGVEMAGQRKELSRRALRSNYRRIDPSSTRVLLVEGGGLLVPAMGERLAKMTERDMGRLGV
jgi:NADH:ubiquinone reductase (H+-translocating)